MAKVLVVPPVREPPCAPPCKRRSFPANCRSQYTGITQIMRCPFKKHVFHTIIRLVALTNSSTVPQRALSMGGRPDPARLAAIRSHLLRCLPRELAIQVWEDGYAVARQPSFRVNSLCAQAPDSPVAAAASQQPPGAASPQFSPASSLTAAFPHRGLVHELLRGFGLDPASTPVEAVPYFSLAHLLPDEAAGAVRVGHHAHTMEALRVRPVACDWHSFRNTVTHCVTNCLRLSYQGHANPMRRLGTAARASVSTGTEVPGTAFGGLSLHCSTPAAQQDCNGPTSCTVGQCT